MPNPPIPSHPITINQTETKEEHLEQGGVPAYFTQTPIIVSKEGRIEARSSEATNFTCTGDSSFFFVHALRERDEFLEVGITLGLSFVRI